MARHTVVVSAPFPFELGASSVCLLHQPLHPQVKLVAKAVAGDVGKKRR